MKTKVPFTGRCLWLCVIVLAISSTIACRLVELQVVDSDNHGRIAADELIEKERIPAQRGIIMDRNEEILTNNIQTAEMVADRHHLREITAVVDGLAYNQLIHNPEWGATVDEDKRTKLFYAQRSTLLKKATKEMTKEERAELRRAIDPKDANANRLLEYDPEICAEYYRAHDELVAEILYPFLSSVEIADETDSAENGQGKKPAKESKTRFMTKQDIINLIAQPDVAEYNKTAEAEGKPLRRYRNQIILAKGLPLDTSEKIKSALKEAHIRGIIVQSSLRRAYVAPQTLCHVLGYVNYENKGMSGVEAYFNSYLAGIDGIREYRHNNRGQVLPNEDDRYMPPKHGLNLRLTIDMRLQTICEEELDAGLRHFRSKRGCMIVVDPKTGDILAMASRPAFNLNTKKVITPEGEQQGEVKNEKGERETGDFNFACQARYEPGSTFKVIGVTTALDKKILGLNSPISCEWFSVGNSAPITDRPFHNGTLTVGQVLKKSSNPGAARIALACKWPNFKEYLHRYGIDAKADIDLPNGGPCIISDGTNIVNFSRMAYGYSLAVSPLHMAMVYATIANNGVRMKPRLIDKIIAANGSVYSECEPKEECRVMSPQTAQSLRIALESVTDGDPSKPAGRGTASRAAIPGFRIGGKTGTAKKVSSGGGYHNNLYTVSFAGILPIDNPRLVVMTVVDAPHPTDCNPGGGTVAAPIFRHAAERFINVLNLTPADPAAYEKYRNRDKSKDTSY